MFTVICLLSVIATCFARPNVAAVQTLNMTKGVGIGKNNSQHAYEMFSIVLSDDAEDASNRMTKHVVLRDGEIQDEWAHPVSGGATDDTSLFLHGQYADRITFDFFFGAHVNYMIGKPTVNTSQPNVVAPRVSDYSLDVEEHSGSFTIVYNCKKSQTRDEFRNATVRVNLPVASGMSARFAFRKTCGGGGVHPYIEFGYYEESENEAMEVSRALFLPGGPKMVVGPHVMSTKVYMHLLSPAENQEFFAVKANASGPGVWVTAQGPVFGGVLRASRSTFIYLFYDCHEKGKHEISISIPVHPYKELQASWTKDCGGGVADGLSIGTEPWGSSDVVNKGETEPKWRHALRATSASVDKLAPVVNASVRLKDFWLVNEGIAVQIAPAVITIEKQEMLSVHPGRSSTRGSVYRTESGGLLPSGGKFRLRLRMVCKRHGRSLVVVTFPIKSFAKVDFGFVKECRAPRKYVQSGFLRTANSVMMMVSLAFVAFCTVFWRFAVPVRQMSGKRVVTMKRDGRTKTLGEITTY